MINSVPTPSQRSRNVTDSSMLKGNAAGQSTLSFFNTKKGLTSNTLNKVLSTNDQSQASMEGVTDTGQANFF